MGLHSGHSLKKKDTKKRESDERRKKAKKERKKERKIKMPSSASPSFASASSSASSSSSAPPPCPFGSNCRMCIDPDHRAAYSHTFTVPSSSSSSFSSPPTSISAASALSLSAAQSSALQHEKVWSALSPAAASIAAMEMAVKSASLPPCKFKAECRMLDPSHPTHEFHCSRWSHPSSSSSAATATALTVAAAAPSSAPPYTVGQQPPRIRRACFPGCKLQDPQHLVAYTHICPHEHTTHQRGVSVSGCQIPLDNNEHYEQYFHFCPNGSACGDRAPEHCGRYYHPPVPHRSTSATALDRAEEKATIGPEYEEGDCRHGGACRMLNPAHPKHQTHCAKFRHTGHDLTSALTAAPQTASEFFERRIPSTHCEAYGQCRIGEIDPEHCVRVKHPCAHESDCGNADPSHLDSCLHPCPNGYHCQIPSNDIDHERRYYHPERWDNTAARGPCSDGEICIDHSPLHRLRYTHPCPLALLCPKLGTDKEHSRLMSHREERRRCPQQTTCTDDTPHHRASYLHPCPNGLDCPDIDDSKHWLQWLHICEYIEEECPLVQDSTHCTYFDHLPLELPYCPNGVQCAFLESVAHRDYLRHVCVFQDQCPLLKQKNEEHELRFLHPCPYKQPCRLASTDPYHAYLYQHPCPNGHTCPRVHDQHHAMRYTHILQAAALGFPKCWDLTVPAGGSPLFFLLNRGSAEFQQVEQAVLQSLPRRSIVSISRYQNAMFYQSYALRRQYIADKKTNKGDAHEMMLFHGTRPEVAQCIFGDAVKNIPAQGFDHRVADPNGECGIGIYFAPHASTAMDPRYVGSPDASGCSVLLYCLVSIGQFAAGQKGMRRPPSMLGQLNILFDSVASLKGPNGTPREYVVFEDNQAYPLYKILVR